MNENVFYIFKNISFLKGGVRANFNTFNEFEDSASFSVECEHVSERISTVTSELFSDHCKQWKDYLRLQQDSVPWVIS